MINPAVISINNCKIEFLFSVNISLILNSFYNTALFDKKKVSLFNVYAIRVGLNNAAT